MLHKKTKTKSGYTIIETMVAVSLFVVVIVFGMNTLLNANVVGRKSQDLRSIMDNLNFIMEDISRNARTGYDYECYSPPVVIAPVSSPGNDPKSCVAGSVIFFETSDGDNTDRTDQWVYKIEETANGSGEYNIFKSVEGGEDGTFVQLNPPEVTLTVLFGFSVLGAERPAINPLNDDRQQPLLTIRLVGEIEYKDTITPFSLQTSVSQRLIDVKF